MVDSFWFVLVAVIAYVLGSFPTAYYVAKAIVGKDVRLSGSHNIGAMNTYRLVRAERSTKLGIVGFAMVLVGDMGKGALAIFVAEWLSVLSYNQTISLIIAGFFVVLGHNYSVFLKFRGGGRGIASLGGIILALNPPAFFIGLGVLLLSIFLIQRLRTGMMRWGQFTDVFSVVGSQLVGRVVGLVLAVVAIYVFSPGIILPVLAGISLVLIKHINRVKAYIREP